MHLSDCPFVKPQASNNAEWSSQEARWAHNPKVAGSNPASATSTMESSGKAEHRFVPLDKRRQNKEISVGDAHPRYYGLERLSIGLCKHYKHTGDDANSVNPTSQK